MTLIISKIVHFFKWWYSTLISCLPHSWTLYFGGINKNIDLIIINQGNTIFVQTEKGKIIDSISLNSEKNINAIDESVSISSGFSSLTGVDSDNLSTEKLALKANFESSNIDQTVILDEGQSNVVSLQPIKFKKEVDVTVFDDDITTQYLDINSDSEEDTIIIKNDQGQLINLNDQNDDNTFVFQNEGGKIRRVESSLIKPDIDEITVDDEDQKSNLKNFDVLNEYEVVARLLAMYQGSKKCLYLLPDNKVFTINLSYPVQVAQNIESVLRFDLQKHIPLSLQEVRYFYALNFNSVPDKVTVEVAVIKSEDFDLLNMTLEPYINKGLLCTTKSFFEKYGRKINFLENISEHKWYSIFRASNVHLIFNSALLIILLALPYYLYHQYNDKLIVNSSEEMKRVQDIISSMNSVSAESKFGKTLSQQISDVPRLTKFLSVMSEEIDQQAWLSRYSFKNNEIRIKGEAVSATAVSDELSDTGLFDSIKFVSSIRKNARTDKESFELLLRIKSGA
ncbi:MAG: hypothetical protein HOM14_05690 [Gammaproteobacteria bacterium]|jgi:general secretion pathway protein L|nr:hypothetical protein [Gammaproteobacteria bacterium]MBT3725235.1 hypothetical protein [Gammaproteobacteria bacterium]MBT4195193.1 hypothetical protein [Gammaproteobacteria bacterium]MBT4449881.1 hypothetical protein [Gammaproteobacteria bacterium]MBT4863422.1 hypothetical protein [Gammaproteobacteria bacterium]